MFYGNNFKFYKDEDFDLIAYEGEYFDYCISCDHMENMYSFQVVKNGTIDEVRRGNFKTLSEIVKIIETVEGIANANLDEVSKDEKIYSAVALSVLKEMF